MDLRNQCAGCGKPVDADKPPFKLKARSGVSRRGGQLTTWPTVDLLFCMAEHMFWPDGVELLEHPRMWEVVR